MRLYLEGFFSDKRTRSLLLLLNILLFAVFVYSLNKTFDVTDEAYNLLLCNPTQDVYFSQTYFFDLVRYFLGEKSQILLLNRVLSFLLLLFSHLCFLLALQKLLSVKHKALFRLFSLLGFYYCAAYTQITISYNLLNTILSLFSAAALLMAIHQQERRLWSWVFFGLAGFFLSLVLVVKFTTFFTLLALWLLTQFLLVKGNAAKLFSFLLLLSGIATGILFYVSSIRGLDSFKQGTAKGIAAYQALEEYTFQHNLSRMGIYMMAFIVMSAVFYLFFLLAGRFKNRLTDLISCFFFVAVAYIYYKYSTAVAGLLLAFVAFTISWLLYSKMYKLPREQWVVLLCCFLIPYCNVIGTSDNYDFGLAHIAIPIVAVLGWFFIEVKHELSLRNPILLVFGILSFLIISYKVIRAPYRFASLYHCKNDLAELNSHFSGIYVDDQTYDDLETLQEIRKLHADKFFERKIVAANDIIGLCSFLGETMPGTVLFGTEFSSLYLGNLQEAIQQDSSFSAPVLLFSFDIDKPGTEKGKEEFLKQLWQLLGQKGIAKEDYQLFYRFSRNTKQNKDLFFYGYSPI